MPKQTPQTGTGTPASVWLEILEGVQPLSVPGATRSAAASANAAAAIPKASPKRQPTAAAAPAKRFEPEKAASQESRAARRNTPGGNSPRGNTPRRNST